MSWKNIKIYALIILIVMNVIVAALLISSGVSDKYYDGGSIDNLLSVLKKDDIIIEESNIPREKISLSVHETKFEQSSLLTVAEIISGAEGKLSDESVICENENGRFTINNDFSFSYFTGFVPDDTIRKSVVGSKSILKQYEDIGIAFMKISEVQKCDFNTKSQRRTTYAIETLYRCNDGTYETIISEYLGSYKTGNKLRIVTHDNVVIFAEGTMMFVLPQSTFSVKNYDILTILTSEKNYFSKVEHDVMTVDSIEYGYELCFDVFGTGFLIPVCNISYITGILHSYDLVTGEMISG